MGGDRDGNPNVQPNTTRDVAIWCRLSAVNLYFTTVQNLMFDLSLWRCSKEMKQYAEAQWATESKLDKNAVAEERKRRKYVDFWTPVPPTEPYRCVLSQVRQQTPLVQSNAIANYCCSASSTCTDDVLVHQAQLKYMPNPDTYSSYSKRNIIESPNSAADISSDLT